MTDQKPDPAAPFARRPPDEPPAAVPTPPEAAPDPGRRDALSKLALACGCTLGAATLIGPAGVALSPLLAPSEGGEGAHAAGEEDPWLVVDTVQRFAVGAAPARVVLRRDVRDQWLVRRGQTLGAVLVERLADSDFRVLSAVCPHLGCSVVWDATLWRCPCHKSAFSRDGALVPSESGPPNPAPRALDPLEWRVSQGRLEVRWVRYETGIAERRRV